ncbi:MAG: hypothetical protein ACE5HI_09540 [bacterium]
MHAPNSVMTMPLSFNICTPPPIHTTNNRFSALSNQTARLGALIQSAAALLSSEAGNAPGFVPKVPPDLSATRALPGKSHPEQLTSI